MRTGLSGYYHWHGVDEGLPECGVRVQVCRSLTEADAEGNRIRVEEGWLTESREWYSVSAGYVDDVAAWTELAAPPEAGWIAATLHAVTGK